MDVPYSEDERDDGLFVTLQNYASKAFQKLPIPIQNGAIALYDFVSDFADQLGECTTTICETVARDQEAQYSHKHTPALIVSVLPSSQREKPSPTLALSRQYERPYPKPPVRKSTPRERRSIKNTLLGRLGLRLTE